MSLDLKAKQIITKSLPIKFELSLGTYPLQRLEMTLAFWKSFQKGYLDLQSRFNRLKHSTMVRSFGKHSGLDLKRGFHSRQAVRTQMCSFQQQQHHDPCLPWCLTEVSQQDMEISTITHERNLYIAIICQVSRLVLSQKL